MSAQSVSGDSSGLSFIVKRALEGRISPLNFLLLLGFISSLVLLYISLHFYVYNISEEIATSRERAELLENKNGRLMIDYNDLVSAERIIPISKKLGLRAGTPHEVRRLAIYEERAPVEELDGWAQASIISVQDSIPNIDTRGR